MPGLCLAVLRTSSHDLGQVFQVQWRGDVIFSHGTSSARGVCISFRPNIEKQILSPPICDNTKNCVSHTRLKGTVLRHDLNHTSQQ